MNHGRLFWAQRGLCFHCHKPMLMHPIRQKADGSLNDGYTLEHVLPRSRGGRNYRNVVLAHSKCNQERGNANPTEEMIRRCETIWDDAYRPPHKIIKRSLIAMGWKSQYRRLMQYSVKVTA